MTVTRFLLLCFAAALTLAEPATARVLDSATGRWLTRDPAGAVDGPNLYSYGKGAPLSGTDPRGLSWAVCTDRVTLRCRQIIFGFQHCVVRCEGCDGVDTTYSLNPESIPHGPVDRSPNQPDDTDPGIEWSDKCVLSGSGLCERLKTISEANQDKPWNYNAGNCNSNWYADSLIRCATGSSCTDLPGGDCDDSGWDPARRDRYRTNPPYFRCPAGNPGSGIDYTTPVPNPSWPDRTWEPSTWSKALVRAFSRIGP